MPFDKSLKTKAFTQDTVLFSLPSLIPVSFLVLEEKVSASRRNPPVHTLASQPLPPPLETSSVNFPLQHPPWLPPSRLQLSDQYKHAQFFCIAIHSTPMELSLPLLSSSLLCQRVNQVICSASISSPPTHSSFQSTLVLALISPKSYSAMSPVTPYLLDSQFSSNSIPLVCTNAVSSILKCSLCDSFGLHFPGSLSYVYDRSSPTLPPFLFPGFFLDLSFARVRLSFFFLLYSSQYMLQTTQSHVTFSLFKVTSFCPNLDPRHLPKETTLSF